MSGIELEDRGVDAFEVSQHLAKRLMGLLNLPGQRGLALDQTCQNVVGQQVVGHFYGVR